MRRRARWYVPSWHGDLRLEASEDDPKKTVLSIENPTPEEQRAIGAILGSARAKEWTERGPTDPVEDGERILLSAPLEEVGPMVVSILRPGPGILTAIRMSNGKVEVTEHGLAGKSTEKELKKLAEKPAKAAATVKRPTPSCPDCYVKAVAPATEVLLSFLSEEQHETWARDRYVTFRGGLTGHRYLVAHRDSEIAAKNGRICFDADDVDVLHFHDQSVPAEEEVLAAMLILQHREPWLRNQATCLGLRFRRVFDNPFGDMNDGVPDREITKAVGMVAPLIVSALEVS